MLNFGFRVGYPLGDRGGARAGVQSVAASNIYISVFMYII